MAHSRTSVTPYRVGAWLPSDQAVLENWLTELLAVVVREPRSLLPVIQNLKELIEGDPAIFMYFNLMFTQVPNRPPYNESPTGKPQVTDYKTMLRLMNHVMTTPPAYNSTGLVGFPINAILDWSMGTEAGYAAFLDDKVNSALKDVLNAWGRFLTSTESLAVLNDDPKTGWLGDAAMIDMVTSLPEYVDSTLLVGLPDLLEAEKARLDYILECLGISPAEFNAVVAQVQNGVEAIDGTIAKVIFALYFHCDPTLPFWGYTCWDDFFTRTFREGRRPVAGPDDQSVIANACEAAPFAIQRNVSESDRFWTKGMPYSLRHMLADDPFADQFIGGTVYQAFLSATSYHRWNSPVAGTVIKGYVVDGAYYSEPPAQGFANPGNPADDPARGGRQPDPSAPNNSQGYIAEVATRALIFIKADNPAIDLVCFIGIGMGEVSSCDITVYDGQHVEKGDQIGTFHFGGSTHCLVFRPGVALDFDLHGQAKPSLNATNIAVRAKIATVTSG